MRPNTATTAQQVTPIQSSEQHENTAYKQEAEWMRVQNIEQQVRH